MKRVHCLYRVSTKRQVGGTQTENSDESDIPMQRTACHEFASRNHWAITKEYYEKGISGFKVSANNRDSIQDLKVAAEKQEFDVLLVYMFDRIGRIDNETPFVVEWFVQQGIEVWSVTEGEQRFDSHVDKLTNYIQFWQANGESRKTSMRVKDCINQLTEQGIYTGGVTPFGYKTVPSGRLNKNGKELVDIEIAPDEAAIVRLIYEKTIQESYGSHRLASLLNGINVQTHNGSSFQSNTINRILKNHMYCGYYVSGDILSPHLPHLQIIDEESFKHVQKILEQRSKKNDVKTQNAHDTKEKAFLSDNIYCAHCGSHLIATSYLDSRARVNGSKYDIQRQRYICQTKAQRRGVCDGQSGYTSERIDSAVSTIILKYLSRIKTAEESIALEKRYHDEAADIKAQIRKTEQEHKRLKGQWEQLIGEVAKSLTGESEYTPEVLSKELDDVKAELKNTGNKLVQLDRILNNSKWTTKNLNYHYTQLCDWAEEFENAGLEQCKMIIRQLVREIKVSKGYKLDIILHSKYEQFL